MLRHLAVAALLALPTAGQAYETIKDKNEFLKAIEGKELRIGLYGLSLRVLPEGGIEGRALGSGVKGTWTWREGYFCREMDWSGREIPYNCQLVEKRGDKLRFTTDKGAGNSAAFDLR